MAQCKTVLKKKSQNITIENLVLVYQEMLKNIKNFVSIMLDKFNQI